MANTENNETPKGCAGFAQAPGSAGQRCPFCLARRNTTSQNESGICVVLCLQCGATGPAGNGLVQAIERWDQAHHHDGNTWQAPRQPTALGRKVRNAGLLITFIVLIGVSPGCAVRSVHYSRSVDGTETVKSRTVAVLTKISGESLSEDLQSENFIAGTRAGTLRVEPDSESIKAIAEGVTAAALKAVMPKP